MSSSRRTGGSATVEVVVLVPFVLVFLAVVWDTRQFIAYRTELAREMYIVAETIANNPAGGPPLESVIEQVGLKYGRTSVSGSIHAAVVVRGTQRDDGSACPAGDWCLPMVTLAWPATTTDLAGTWSEAGGTECARPPGSVLPAAGDHFGATDVMLPNEGADPDGDGPLPAPPPQDWISRNLTNTEWWLVVDACVEPRPGLFIGRLTNWADRMLDTSFAWQRRAAWRSIHDRLDCDWCEPTP